MIPEGTGSDIVELEAEPLLKGDRLEVGYTLHNRGDRDLFVYAHPDDGRRADVLPGTYVCVSREHGELRLLLGKPPAPLHVNLQRGVIPLAKIVAPGGRLAGRVDMELPVREWSAYLTSEYPPDCPLVSVEAGSLTIEFFPTEEAIWIESGPEEGTFWTEAAGPRSRTVKFRFSRPVPVLERTDPFVRF